MSNARPPPAQRRPKLRLRSTPRAFWRVPRRTPSGLTVSTSHSSTPAGGVARRRREITARPAVSLPWIEPTTKHLHRTLPHALGAQRLVIGGVAEQERRGGGSQGEHPRHGSVRDRHGLDRHRRRGDVRRLARVVAGARRRAGHARRPVRARRPPRDLGRRDAPDPLRPRRGRVLHRLRPPRAHAVAGARGGVGRRPADRVRARVVRPPGRRLGGGVRGDHARPGHPGRAAGRRGGRAAVPELPGRRPRVPPPRAGGRRAARAEGGPDAGRAGVPATARSWSKAAPRPKATTSW